MGNNNWERIEREQAADRAELEELRRRELALNRDETVAGDTNVYNQPTTMEDFMREGLKKGYSKGRATKKVVEDYSYSFGHTYKAESWEKIFVYVIVLALIGSLFILFTDTLN